MSVYPDTPTPYYRKKAEEDEKPRAQKTHKSRGLWPVYILLGVIVILQILQFEIAREDHNIQAGFTDRRDYVKW